MATERLNVILQMVAGQYNSEARKAARSTSSITQETKAASKSTGGLKTQMSSLGGVLTGAAVAGGILAIGRGLGSAVEAAEQAASAMANTQQIIETTGGVANVTADDVANLSGRLSALTGVQDEVVQEGANVLLTFKGIRNEAGEGNDVFDRTAELMLDISSVMGTDASSAAVQLGKALNDPVANMGALSRAGLTFSEQQKDQIKSLVANNDLLGAQKLILGELESQLGGTAAASADASDKISNAVGEFGEGVGSVLLPFLEDVADELQLIAGLTDELDFVAAKTGGAAESAAAFLTVVQTETGGAGFLTGVGTAVEEFTKFLIPGISRTEEFRDKLEGLAKRLDVKELKTARDGVDELGESMGLTASEIEIVADVLDNELSRAASETADRALLGRLAPAIEQVGDETETTTTQLGLMSDQINSLIDPAFAALDALDRVKQSQTDLNNAVSEYGPESQQAQDAAQDLLENYGDLVAAADRYSQESGKDIIESLRELGEQAGIPLETIEKIIDALDRVDGFVATARVDIQTSGATSFADRVSGFRAHGGPVEAGRTYVVGERGPELFIPTQSGQVVANGSTSVSPVAGPTIYVGTVYGFDDFASKVRDANINIARLGG